MRLEEEYTLDSMVPFDPASSDRSAAGPTTPTNSRPPAESFPWFEDPVDDHSFVIVRDLAVSNVSHRVPKSMRWRFTAIQIADYTALRHGKKDQDGDSSKGSEESSVDWLRSIADSLAPPSRPTSEYMRDKLERDLDFGATAVDDAEGTTRMIPKSAVRVWKKWDITQQDSFVSMPKDEQKWYGEKADALDDLHQRMMSALSLQSS